MKKFLLMLLVVGAGVMYSNTATATATTANAESELVNPGDPAQRLIDKINTFTTLTQAQVDEILAISANIDWESFDTPEAYKAQFKLLKQSVRQDVITPTQWQEILDAKEG
ncbi:MAG: hypothetical protein GYB31_02060 [Bacteroidetes bacterium]|nr:hypothetical protein [Bacteroidota bacterium]